MDYVAARQNMVDCQIRPNKVTDPLVISTLREIQREIFVPADKKGTSYLDADVEVAPGRVIMQPMVFARLVQLAEIRRNDAILDVGCATGYSSAVLAKMGSSVVALEENAELAKQASETLLDYGIDNAVVVEGPLAEGLPKQGPYDVIFINGSVDRVPDALREQLAEGGRLVAVVHGKGIGRATLVTRRAGAFGSRIEFDAAIAPLPGFAVEKAFAL